MSSAPYSDTTTDSTLIEAPFQNKKKRSWVASFEWVLIGLIALICLVALVIYGFIVNEQAHLTELSSKAQRLHEENLTLEVELNRLRSFESLTADLNQVPHLQEPVAKIQLQKKLGDTETQAAFASLVTRASQSKSYPSIYGY